MVECTGTGRRWSTGTVPANPICPVCHRGPNALGVKRPTRRKGRYDALLPAHEMRSK